MNDELQNCTANLVKEKSCFSRVQVFDGEDNISHSGYLPFAITDRSRRHCFDAYMRGRYPKFLGHKAQIVSWSYSSDTPNL